MLRKKRYFLVVMTLIILIGIGYATLSANLSITGYNKKLTTLTVLSDWDIRHITYFGGIFRNTSKNATSKVWYYGPNSINMYENRSSADANYITFEYKER